MEKYIQWKYKHKKADMVVYYSDNVDFKTKTVTKVKEYSFIMMKLICNNPNYESI